jgi:lipoate-protein ligase A
VAWARHRFAGAATDFHARDLPWARGVWTFEVDRPALALGSTQPLEVVRDGAGIEVVRRRSGGGAVLLLPGELLWIDVVLPRGDPLWSDDVGHAAHWLGSVWASALAACGVAAEVHTGPMVRTEWSSLVCFAGRGPGEVFVHARKAVGISQRRTRDGARFQCAIHRRWDPATLVGLLAEPRPTVAELTGIVVEVDVPLADVAAALHAALARS